MNYFYKFLKLKHRYYIHKVWITEKRIIPRLFFLVLFKEMLFLFLKDALEHFLKKKIMADIFGNTVPPDRCPAICTLPCLMVSCYLYAHMKVLNRF